MSGAQGVAGQGGAEPSYVLPAPAVVSAAVAGERARFALRRIYCVGQNYASHAREMGADPKREPPFFFTKPATALLADHGRLPYPARTANLHHEVELVVALKIGGRRIVAASALEHVYGYAIGNDFTRRDLQAAAKEKGRPWDVAKGFDYSAALGPITPVARVGHPAHGAIWLSVNGLEKQRADLADMIWKVADVLAELSTFFELAPGDLIYTGTPAGVGPVVAGDVLVGGIDGLGTLTTTVVAPLT